MSSTLDSRHPQLWQTLLGQFTRACCHISIRASRYSHQALIARGHFLTGRRLFPHCKAPVVPFPEGLLVPLPYSEPLPALQDTLERSAAAEATPPYSAAFLLKIPLGNVARLPLQCVQFSSVAQSCPTLCDPMDCSTPGLRVHHQLPELPQTHVHRVGDAIQPSHPLSSPSPSAFNLSQHQGLFQ